MGQMWLLNTKTLAPFINFSIWSTWWLHRGLATDVPFIACVINSPSTFTYHLDLSNFILESGLSYFRVFNHLSPVGLFRECCRVSLL